MNVFDRLDELLEGAEQAATLETASFGFPNDRIEIKEVHCPLDEKGRPGDVIHPTDYIRTRVHLHHESWIIGPIQQARKLIAAQKQLIEGADNLRNLLSQGEIEMLTEAMKAGRDD